MKNKHIYNNITTRRECKILRTPPLRAFLQSPNSIWGSQKATARHKFLRRSILGHGGGGWERALTTSSSESKACHGTESGRRWLARNNKLQRALIRKAFRAFPFVFHSRSLVSLRFSLANIANVAPRVWDFTECLHNVLTVVVVSVSISFGKSLLHVVVKFYAVLILLPSIRYCQSAR